MNIVKMLIAISLVLVYTTHKQSRKKQIHIAAIGKTDMYVQHSQI